MKVMAPTSLGSGRRCWYGVALGIAAGLIVQDECPAFGGEFARTPVSGLHVWLTGSEPHSSSLKHPVAEGTVTRYLLDPRGEVEGLLLQDGTHMHITSRASDKLLQAIKPGHHVRVHGHRQEGEPLVQADVILNLTTGTIFTVPFRLDLPVPEKEHHLAMTELRAEGTIEALLYHGLKGVVQGMLLSDGTQVRLPPDISDDLRRSFRVGDHVMAEGNGTVNEHGRCLEALMMSVDGGKVTPLDRTVTKLH